MLKVIELNFYDAIGGYLVENADDNTNHSGQYVSLTDYQELSDRALICAADVLKLSKLLARVVEIGPNLDIRPSLWNDNKEKFRELLAEIKDAMKAAEEAAK